jgi:hypothetical protein
MKGRTLALSAAALVMTCVLCAALESSEAAGAVLAQALRDRADAFSARLSRLQPRGDESGLAAAMRRHAIWCRRAALAWADGVNADFLGDSSYWANAFDWISAPSALRRLKTSGAEALAVSAPR